MVKFTISTISLEPPELVSPDLIPQNYGTFRETFFLRFIIAGTVGWVGLCTLYIVYSVRCVLCSVLCTRVADPE